MKRIICLISGLLFLTLISAAQEQVLIRNSKVSGKTLAGTKVTRIYLPPPDRFLKSQGVKGGGTISVSYSGFTTAAKTSLAYAIAILESILPADTKVNIAASFEPITTSGVLASSSITGYATGWSINAQNPMAYYPVALAEKIAGKSLHSDSEADINLSVNSTMNWYFGTDGNTPVQKYDLVTVALHEICHGLGFYDGMDANTTIGWDDYGNIPLIFDSFVENLQGQKITDTLLFPDRSALLKNQLTGLNLYFNAPLLSNYTNGGRAKLYAPAVWSSGSSISHLDESATLQINSLMTPFINMGEAIHNPGKFTFSILGDLGWINTRIIHTPPHDTEKHLTAIPLSVTIKSDTLYNHNMVGVVYSFDNFKSSDTLLMNSLANDDNYSATINLRVYNSELQYYFYAEDIFKRLYQSPSLVKYQHYSVYVGADTVKPVITSKPVKYYLDAIDSIYFDAKVTDNLGVDTVYVEYKVNDGPLVHLGLKRGLSDDFRNFINAKNLNLAGGDSISYRVIAADSAKVPNLSLLPKSGFFVIKIEGLSSVLTSYSTDFNNPGNVFLNFGFTISKPAGFNSLSLNTKHPYESPDSADQSIEYTSMLKHPLKVDESGMLFTYNEIVLVEPGDPGSVYGSSSFYDYVVVEGSKNWGKKWFPLAEGYDCRYNSTWETAYNSSLLDQNSTATGDPSMIKKHTIFYRPSVNATAGDSMLVRFRLYSDPFAHGWGWLIDDLKINPLIDAVEKNSTGEVQIFPNPGNGIINVRNTGEQNNSSKPIRFCIYNSSGLKIVSGTYQGGTGKLTDISAFPSGLYFIVLYSDDGIISVKYSLTR